MPRLIIILFSMLLFISCKKGTTAPVIYNPTTVSKKFLALGDSYTIGQSVSAAERFPIKTTTILRGYGLAVPDPVIIATTGWTTGNLLNALAANPPTNDYSIVTLLIGVNNQYQGRSINEYTNEFTTLLNQAIHYAGDARTHVFVLSIPDYSVTPFAQGLDTARIAREIDSFNVVNKQVSANLGVNYLDITPISREGRLDYTMQAGDGLHPSGKQYQRWADLLAPMIHLIIQ